MTYGQCTDRANTFFICKLAGSYDFCRVVTAEVLTLFGSKNDSAPALLYSKYFLDPNSSNILNTQAIKQLPNDSWFGTVSHGKRFHFGRDTTEDCIQTETVQQLYPGS